MRVNYEYRVLVRWETGEEWIQTSGLFEVLPMAQSYARVLEKSHPDVSTVIERRPVWKWEEVQ